MNTQARIDQMIREVQTKDLSAEVWQDRLSEWTELVNKLEEERDFAQWIVDLRNY